MQRQQQLPGITNKDAKTNFPSDKAPTMRTRPTNNQLLYKAYFRWNHYPVPESPVYALNETDACASVTAAFLQVMSILQEVEALHCPDRRNVLRILSQDTRHTKVVNLACGTHRVSDELKKHYLTDNDGTQYTTNLDRNRYGTDNQYMFTVIRHNISVLGLCPCLVEVEVLDQKSNETVMVCAGIEACTCEENWQGVKNDKMSCDGESCSQDSSAPSEEKSSGKSTSFVHQSAAPEPFGGKQRSQADSVHTEMDDRDEGEAEKMDSPDSDFHATTSKQGMVVALTATAAARRRNSSNRAKSIWNKRSSPDPDDSDNNKTRSDRPSSQTTSRSDSKRLKSNISGLNYHSKKILDEVLQMKSKLRCVDPLRDQLEEDDNRIRRMEGELVCLRAELRRHVAESREVEAQLINNRRVIGVLLSRLQQSLRAQSGCCHNNNKAESCPHQNGFQQQQQPVVAMMEDLVSQHQHRQRQDESGYHDDDPVKTMTTALPDSMMIALANNALNKNNRLSYEGEWAGLSAATAPTTPTPAISASPAPTAAAAAADSAHRVPVNGLRNNDSANARLSRLDSRVDRPPNADCGGYSVLPAIASNTVSGGQFALDFSSMLGLGRSTTTSATTLMPSEAWNHQSARCNVGQKF